MMNWWVNDSTASSSYSNSNGLPPKTDKTIKQWKFKVKAKTLPGEVLCVTGNSDKLGHWLNDYALVLSNVKEDIWSKDVNIATDVDVRYRYFVGIPLTKEFDGLQKLIVRRWETGIHPRIISAQATYNEQDNSEADIFGQYNNRSEVEKGWLTSETVVQLRLYNKPIQIYKNKLKTRKMSIKLTAVSLGRATGSDPELSSLDEGYSLETTELMNNTKTWPLSEIAVMNAAEREFHEQKQFGHVYTEDEFIVFQTLTHKFESTAYLLDFYTADDNCTTSSDPPTHIGFCHILPSILTNGTGKSNVPIINTLHRRPIGEIVVDYLVITPISHQSDMKITFTSQWRDSWQGLDVGHRGSGVSFGTACDIECADVRENTIASLKEAGEHGADLVEFDVQLSKELVPVVYHDFYVAISIRRKVENGEHGELNDVIKVPVKDLTLDEMRSLKFYHVKEGINKTERIFTENQKEENQPFPTLEQVMKSIDLSVGFNIELKWTMQVEDGTYELDHPFEMNLYVDNILSVVMQYSNVRNIVFSSFNPDIVTMIRLKQNKYPVVFLTQGITTKWPKYKDPRCHNVSMGTHHAVSANLLGLNVHTEDLLRDESQIKFIIDSGLVVWCWGVHANNRTNVKHLKELGVQAVINDKVVEFSAKNESVFLIEAREASTFLNKIK